MKSSLFLQLALSVLLIVVLQGSVAAETIRPHQGRYWKWVSPDNWKQSESIAGVTLTSPDNNYTSALAGLMRSQGQTNPQTFMVRMLSMAYKDVRISHVSNLPDRTMGYQRWQWIEAEVTATGANGVPMKGLWKCGVANYYNLHDAIIIGFWAPQNEFQQAKSWLNPLAEGIVLTNPNEAFGNNQLLHPHNNPNTTLDTITQAWENKNKSQDKSMQRWSNAMRGNEPTFDPATGERFSTQHNSWDATRGGYVNPRRPTELLQCGTPEDPHPCTK